MNTFCEFLSQKNQQPILYHGKFDFLPKTDVSRLWRRIPWTRNKTDDQRANKKRERQINKKKINCLYGNRWIWWTRWSGTKFLIPIARSKCKNVSIFLGKHLGFQFIIHFYNRRIIDKKIPFRAIEPMIKECIVADLRLSYDTLNVLTLFEWRNTQKKNNTHWTFHHIIVSNLNDFGWAVFVK